MGFCQKKKRVRSMYRWINSRQFAFQLILIFVIFTLATVIALGIPVTIILNRQVDAQMGVLLAQANQTTVALYENKLNQMDELVALITERPTLNRLVRDLDDLGELDRYLDEFLDNANANMIAVCQQSTPIAIAGESADPVFCAPARFDTFVSVNQGVWLLMDGQLTEAEAEDYHVVVGQRAESIFDELKSQSGLEYALYDQRGLVVVSQVELRDSLWRMNLQDIAQDQKLALDAENSYVKTHLAGLIPLTDQSEFTLIGLLDIGAYQALSRDVRIIIVVTLLTVSLVGGIVAILVSRQISQPLNRLAKSAVALREGDLTTPLSARSQIWEIDQLTNALEDARVSLKYSLDQLQREKSWMENLLNAVVEGLLAIDKFQRITFASEAIERILGVEKTTIVGHSIDDVFRTPGGENQFSQQLLTISQSRRIPIVIDDREILLSVSVSRLVPPDAGDATLAVVIRDVTDEERIHRLLGEFLANITHEFRTPLTALSASVELLLDQLPGLSLPETEHLLHALNIGIIDLQSLIDNLIEAASIEAGRFKVNPQFTPLQAIISDAISTVDPIAQRGGLTLVHHDSVKSVTAKADRRRTCQALVNLLSNAIKHSPEGGIVAIFSQVVGDEVRVEVHDQGEGVPQKQRANLFNRFITPGAQGDDGQPGLGLGLSVVKAIIEAQGGSVGYRDGEAGGAVFWFTLPLLKDDAQ
jgi:PAS domain S-box-containing protein